MGATAPEDVIALKPSSVAAGPLITGTIQPDRRADLRHDAPAHREIVEHLAAAKHLLARVDAEDALVNQ